MVARAFLPVFTCVLFTWGTVPAAAQSGQSLSVAVGTHSLTVPWHLGPVTSRFNPAIVIGADRTLRPGTGWRLYHTANVGFFQHHWWMTGAFIDAEVGLGRTLPLGLHSDLRLGVGYLHYFLRRQTLELEDGEYVPATDLGRPSLMVPLSLLLGYQGSSRQNRVEPFVSLQWAAQGVFKPEVPALTHFFVLVGARFRLGSSESPGD